MNEKKLENRRVTFTAYYNDEGRRVNTTFINETDQFNKIGVFQGYTDFTTADGEEILVAIVFGDGGTIYNVPSEFVPDFE